MKTTIINTIVVIVAILVLGLGIYMTIYFIQEDHSERIPFLWIITLACYAEIINVGIIRRNKKK